MQVDKLSDEQQKMDSGLVRMSDGESSNAGELDKAITME